ncbi:putative F-box domain, galactose oxidase, beta-propeller [Rosa chinensis]|uniref:Putative F-box domain, galactose oxidase, beta-propeller n=1 Tax=Rosa chinensis TaxID=74649 RepID=A0A2P6QNF9_ROSCH|nr:F-box/kelch-repeat protein At1g15670 [Rosa chinensis]PRQ35714.1 putative F-box domain, galactose oxidase, beta-propeller [Rosa chinensis]
MHKNQFSAEMGIPKVPEWIPGLPEELGLECLTRLPYSAHPTASRVCRPWRSLLESEEFYRHRKQNGYTRNVACLVQAVAVAVELNTGPKSGAGGSPSYGIAVFDSVSGTWERLDPIPKYPNGLPMFCRVASCEGKLVVMGGWDPATYKPVTDVFVYEFTTCRWRRGAAMPSKRSFFAIGSRGSRVYVAGGHDESKNALKSAWVYDLRRDEWAELTQMSRERDECHGVVIGDEFWVVSGYGTASQGAFEGGAEALDLGSGRWRRVEGAWEEGECPRACGGGVGRDGRLVSWAEFGPAVRVGTRGVNLGSRVLVMGSEYDGGSQGVFMKDGQNGKLERVSVPEEFSGFIQSGCCVEI